MSELVSIIGVVANGCLAIRDKRIIMYLSWHMRTTIPINPVTTCQIVNEISESQSNRAIYT